MAANELTLEELEQRRAYYRARYAKTRAKSLGTILLWQERNRDRYLETRKLWRSTEKVRNREREQCQKYKDKMRALDPEHFKKRAQQFWDDNRIRALIAQAKCRARKRGLDFDGLPELVGTRPLKCRCCGVDLDYRHRGRSASPSSPSLDRMDNARGYVSGNVSVICYRCNNIKGNSSLEEIEMIASYMRSALPNGVPL